MNQSELDKIQSTCKRYTALGDFLGKCRLPGLLLGAAAGVALVAFVAAPVMGLALQGIVMGGTFAAVVGGGTAFGFVDKYASRFGERGMILSLGVARHQLGRVEEDFKKSLPLKDDAKKAFIMALTDGIKEKLHIGKPLQLKSAPAPAPAPAAAAAAAPKRTALRFR